MKMLKGMILGLVLAITLTSVSGYSEQISKDITAYYRDIKIMINGELKTTSKEPFIMDDSTYVPLRFISEALGKNVDWDGNTRTVIINDKNSNEENNPTDMQTVNVNQTITKNNVKVTLEKMEIEDNRTKLYVRVENNSQKNVTVVDTSTVILQAPKQYNFYDNFAEDRLKDIKSFPQEIYPEIVSNAEIAMPTISKGAKKATINIRLVNLKPLNALEPFEFNVNW